MFLLDSNLPTTCSHEPSIATIGRSKFETLLLNARLLTSHRIIMNHMKLSTDETESGFTCKLECMLVVVLME